MIHVLTGVTALVGFLLVDSANRDRLRAGVVFVLAALAAEVAFYIAAGG